MELWTSKTDENSPFQIDVITGSGYTCYDCENNNFFDGEFNIYRYYYNDDGEWDFDFEILVPMAIQCAECGSDGIIVEHIPGWYYSTIEGNECYHLSLISDNKLINFEDEEGYSELFESVGCPDDLCQNGAKIYNGFKEVDFNNAPFVNNGDEFEHLVVKIVVKNGMKQNYDDMDGIYDDGGTYKEYQVWTPS